MERTYTYRVSDTRVVPASAVEVMAPTTDSRATLITCTGTFFPLTREYSHRLVVTALLVEP
jgi:sortase (surface protein transpeptidase)